MISRRELVDELRRELMAGDEFHLLPGDSDLGDLGLSSFEIYGTDIETLVLTGQPRNSRPDFRRGDSDTNGRIELTDAVKISGYLFHGSADPASLDATDSNDDGKVDMADAINVLGNLFLGVGRIPAPGPLECDADPTDDQIGCAAYDSCD